MCMHWGPKITWAILDQKDVMHFGNAILSYFKWIQVCRIRRLLILLWSDLLILYLPFWVSKDNQDMRGFRTRSCKKRLKETGKLVGRRDALRDRSRCVQIFGLKAVRRTRVWTCSLRSKRNHQWAHTIGGKIPDWYDKERCGKSFSKGRERSVPGGARGQNGRALCQDSIEGIKAWGRG